MGDEKFGLVLVQKIETGKAHLENDKNDGFR
jgi:hypothetical protein